VEDEVSESKEGRHGLLATLEHWQSTVDERIRTALPNFTAFRELEQEVRRLADRLEALERRLGENAGKDQGSNGS
jgi:hypothetical protein